MKTQIDHIIDIVGAVNIARWLGVDASLPYKWRNGDRGGSSGFIPAQYHRTLIIEARAEGYDLRPEDFIQFENGLPPLVTDHVPGDGHRGK